jgi:hypothetical protein
MPLWNSLFPSFGPLSTPSLLPALPTSQPTQRSPPELAKASGRSVYKGKVAVVYAVPLLPLPSSRASPYRLDLNLLSISCRKGSSRRRHCRRRWTPAEPARRTPALACEFCSHQHLLRPRLDRFRLTPNSGDLGKQPPHKTLARGEAPPAHAQSDGDDGPWP